MPPSEQRTVLYSMLVVNNLLFFPKFSLDCNPQIYIRGLETETVISGECTKTCLGDRKNNWKVRWRQNFEVNTKIVNYRYLSFFKRDKEKNKESQWLQAFVFFRSRCHKVFFKTDFAKISRKFPGKHLPWSSL